MVAKIVPEGRSTFEAITLNRQCWAALDEILVERGNRPVLGLDYLRDQELEQQVVERVRQRKKQQNKVRWRASILGLGGEAPGIKRPSRLLFFFRPSYFPASKNLVLIY